MIDAPGRPLAALARAVGLAVLVALLLGAAIARAQGRDADLEAARRHFQRGSELFQGARYDQALAEFEQARQLEPRPELEYNIARCYDLLEKWQLAAEWYERYAREQPDAPDAAAVRERVRVLAARRAEAAPAIAPGDRVGAPSALRRAAVGVGVAGLALGVAAAGLYGSAAADYGDLASACRARPCTAADWGGAQARADAGYALFGVALVALVAEVVIVVLRGREIRRRNALAPAASLVPRLAWTAP